MRIWEFHFHFHKEKGLKAALKEIKCLIISNQTKIENIMATIQELSAKVDTLQSAIDTEQEQIKTVIEGLQTANAALEALVADGGTAEERQAISDKLDTAIADLQATIAE